MMDEEKPKSAKAMSEKAASQKSAPKEEPAAMEE